MSDPYRNDFERETLNRPVVVERDSAGMGAIAGIAVVALLIVGGFLFYTYSTPNTVVSSNTPVTTAPSVTPESPAAVPARPATPMTPPAVRAQ